MKKQMPNIQILNKANKMANRRENSAKRFNERFLGQTGILLACVFIAAGLTACKDTKSSDSETRPEAFSKSKPLMGAYYYPWYASNGQHWNEGYMRSELIPPQIPLLGEYDSRDEATINQHISWAKDAGIDFFCMSYWGKDTFDDQVIKNHFSKASELKDFKFAILYETLAPTLLGPYHGLAKPGELTFESGNALEQAFVESIDYLAESYFNHPSYLRIDGKPVIILYVTHQFTGDYKGAIEKLRSTIRQKHNMELYLIGDEVDPTKPPQEDRIACFDAITPYIQYASPYQILTNSSLGYADETWILQNARMKNTIFKAISDRLGIGFIPNALPGFNDRGVRLNVDHYYLPHRRNAEDPRPYGLFEDYLQMAGEFMNPDRKIMMITSWNEWHEDSQIEPVIDAPATAEPFKYTLGLKTPSYGFDLLNVLKDFNTSYAQPQQLPPIVPLKISEVCLAYNGLENASYIELFNAGNEEITLDGMRLCPRNKNDTVDRDAYYIRLKGKIPAGAYYLIATPAGRDELKKNTDLETDLTVGNPKFAQISADNGQIAVRDYEGRIVDTFSWTAESAFVGDYVEQENLKLQSALQPNEAMFRRDLAGDQNNSALDFGVGAQSPRK
jgi:hypothetical protein